MSHISLAQAICITCNASIDYSKSIDLSNNDMLKAVYSSNAQHSYSLPQLCKVIHLLSKNPKPANKLHISAIEKKVTQLQTQSPVKQPLINQLTSFNQQNPIANITTLHFLTDKPLEDNTKYIQSIFSSVSTVTTITPSKKKNKKRSFMMMNQENKDDNAHSEQCNGGRNDCPISTIDFPFNKSKKYKYL